MPAITGLSLINLKYLSVWFWDITLKRNTFLWMGKQREFAISATSFSCILRWPLVVTILFYWRCVLLGLDISATKSVIWKKRNAVLLRDEEKEKQLALHFFIPLIFFATGRNLAVKANLSEAVIFDDPGVVVDGFSSRVLQTGENSCFNFTNDTYEFSLIIEEYVEVYKVEIHALNGKHQPGNK